MLLRHFTEEGSESRWDLDAYRDIKVAAKYIMCVQLAEFKLNTEIQNLLDLELMIQHRAQTADFDYKSWVTCCL